MDSQLRLHSMRNELAARNQQLHGEIARRIELAEALDAYRQGLETLVLTRTAELQQRNRDLDIEVAECPYRHGVSSRPQRLSKQITKRI